jgi:hypothetical protein
VGRHDEHRRGAQRDTHSGDLALRVHRALNWLGQAEPLATPDAEDSSM